MYAGIKHSLLLDSSEGLSWSLNRDLVSSFFKNLGNILSQMNFIKDNLVFVEMWKRLESLEKPHSHL